MKKNLSKILLKTDSIIRNPVHLIIITNRRSINHSTIHRIYTRLPPRKLNDLIPTLDKLSVVHQEARRLCV